MIIIIIFLFILLNIIMDQYYKKKFIAEKFPPNILFEIKDDIELPKIEEGENIPKKIYRCYSTREGIEKFNKVFEITQERMPKFEQIKFDDIEIDKYIKDNYSSRIYNAYKKINPDYGASRADLFRYLIIYKEGGVYMDIKSGPNKNIGDLFEEKNKLLVSLGSNYIPNYIPKHHVKELFSMDDDWSFITGVKNGSEWQQFIIASPKGNPILGKVIKQVITNIEEGNDYYNHGKYSVLAMTGPIVYSLVIEKYKNIYKDKIKFYYKEYDKHFSHSLIDYKKIMLNKHYSKIKNLKILNI
jgi:inositol phosphorylceramide mannosyltransferase catalytic subunit